MLMFFTDRTQTHTHSEAQRSLLTATMRDHKPQPDQVIHTQPETFLQWGFPGSSGSLRGSPTLGTGMPGKDTSWDRVPSTLLL